MNRRYPRLQTVIVNLKSGQCIKGVLWQLRREGMVLRQASMFAGETQRPIGMDGEVWIPQENVAFYQVV